MKRGSRPRHLLALVAILGACGSDGALDSEVEADASSEEGTETGEESSEETGDEGPAGPPGEFDFLTYNVAGLPQGLSSSDPEVHMPQISPLLNDFELVVVQEDFWYHAELSGEASHPHQSLPWTDEPSYEDMGDGLNRFSQWPFAMHERVAWWSCNGTIDAGSDCLATKGWSFARHTLAEGIEIDVYNLHMEAGGGAADHEIRDKAADDLIAAITERSEGRAVIVAGDFNLHEEDPMDLAVYQKLVDGLGLSDACWSVSCNNGSIDRVLTRSSVDLELEVTSWSQPPEFIDELDDGGPLSDHLPTAVHIEYTPL